MNAALEEIGREVRRAPMLRASVAFMAGLLVARGLAHSAQIAWALMLLSVSITAVVLLRRQHYGRRWWRGASLAFAMFFLGALWWTLRDPFRTVHTFPDDHDRMTLVEIAEISYLGDRTARFEAVSISVRTEEHVERSQQRMLLTLVYDTLRALPARGDRVWIATSLRAIDRVPDPGGFDRRSYAASRGIRLEAFVPQDDWQLASSNVHWTDMFATARERIAHWLEASGLPKRERALAKALLIGVRDELEQDQKMSFVRSGTMHVLAVSGAHVGLIWAVLNFMLAWFGRKRWPRIARGILILLALWGYAGLTGAEPSVLRATVMCSLFTAGGMFLRRSEHLNSLFAASLCLLIWDPMMLWQLSFQLSFLAVLGIILFYKPLLRLWEPPNRVLHYAWSAAAVSLAAQLTTTPLSLLVFKSFPVWFLPANIVVVGVVTIAVYGCALLLFFFKVPLLGAALTWCMTQLLLFLGWSTTFFSTLPWAYPGVRIELLEALAIYLLIAFSTAWVAWRGRTFRWLVIASLLLVMSGWSWRAFNVNRTVRFAVHDQPKNNMASLQIGRELFVIADDSVRTNPWVERGIEAQERATGVHPPTMMNWDAAGAGWTKTGAAIIGHGFWSLPGLRVRFSGPEPGNSSVALPVDVLVLDADGHYDMDALIAATPPRRSIVLEPTINGLERYGIRRWCEQKGIACHDVKQQGAFIFETRL